MREKGMESLAGKIRAIVQMVWTSLLGLDLQPRGDLPLHAAGQRSVRGWVEISGAWQGKVGLHCSAELARRLAAIVFTAEGRSPSGRDASDLIAELTNITGGNLKAMMPQPSRLSLPVAAEEDDWAPQGSDGDHVVSVAFECLGEPLVVSCLEHRRSRGGAKRER
jgi:chemotaxis protein CheX